MLRVNKVLIFIITMTSLTSKSGASGVLCSSVFLIKDSAYERSLSEDLVFRDQIQQTEITPSEWESCCGRYGPLPTKYPKVLIPPQYDSTIWLQDRVELVAKKYLNLPYMHRHIPKMGGLDCSNFSSWVYNYGLGISFTSNIRKQAYEVGRKLSSSEEIKKGDLIYTWSSDYTWVSHVAIYIGSGKLIDSRGSGVAIREFDGWYKKRFAWARRVIE